MKPESGIGKEQSYKPIEEIENDQELPIFLPNRPALLGKFSRDLMFRRREDEFFVK